MRLSALNNIQMQLNKIKPYANSIKIDFPYVQYSNSRRYFV